MIKITNFTESSYAPWYDYEMMKAEGLGGGEVPQIETGENKITVTIAITYEIN